MIFISEYSMPKNAYLNSGTHIKSQMSKEIGRKIEEIYPFETKESDVDVYITRSLMVMPAGKWDYFKNQLEVVMSASHMSDMQKAEAIKHLLLHIEK